MSLSLGIHVQVPEKRECTELPKTSSLEHHILGRNCAVPSSLTRPRNTQVLRGQHCAQGLPAVSRTQLPIRGITFFNTVIFQVQGPVNVKLHGRGTKVKWKVNGRCSGTGNGEIQAIHHCRGLPDWSLVGRLWKHPSSMLLQSWDLHRIVVDSGLGKQTTGTMQDRVLSLKASCECWFFPHLTEESKMGRWLHSCLGRTSSKVYLLCFCPLTKALWFSGVIQRVIIEFQQNHLPIFSTRFSSPFLFTLRLILT